VSDEKTLGEQLHDRMNDPNKPDQWTLAWWSRQFDELKQTLRGALHTMNQAVAGNRDCWDELKKQRLKLQYTREELERTNSRVGELQAELTEATERLGRIAEWVNEQRGTK
jgi:chromosome segregation ATPase